MNKLTAEKCRERIKKFKRLKKQFGIAMETELSLQAFEIALTVLEQQEKEVRWGAPKSVGQLISQLQTFDPETEITALQRIEHFQDGKQIRQVPLSISWERLDGPWLAPYKGDGRKVIAFWAKPDPREDQERGEPITDNQHPTTDTYRQIENDVWIEWDGGECPVDKNAKVEFKSPGGAAGLQRAKYLNWFHNGAGDDIIAYRVIENDGREG